jgi:hypothetical protein
MTPHRQVVKALVSGERAQTQMLTVDQVFAEEIKGTNRQELWLTPRANEPDSDPNFAARNADRGAHCHGTLSSQAKGEANWWTPQCQDSKHSGTNPSSNGDRMLLVNQVNWPTASVPNGGQTTSGRADKDTKKQVRLEHAVAQWGTPAANDANKTPHCEVNSNQAGLAKSVGLELQRQWATPKTPTGGPETAKRKQELGRTASGGGDLASQANGKLNQAWVCCLMGVPMGWVDPMCPVSVITNWPRFVTGWLRAQTAQIPSGFSAMELCLPPQSELSEFSLAS